MWGYPYLTVLAIVAMLGIVAAMAFIPDQRLPLVFGMVERCWRCWLATSLRRRFGPA